MTQFDKIVFATNNRHKLEEVSAILENKLEILTLHDIGCFEEIDEPGSTLEENALIKARYVYEKYGYSCFADDTGLEVEALDGAPGVFSARYAGEEKSAEANRAKLLDELASSDNRSARFRTVVAWVSPTEELVFEGTVEGVILEAERGDKGFGYDSVFLPDGFTESFAELSAKIKNSISHRGRAVAAFANWFETKIS